jgi:hypothetical protein
MRSTSGIGFNEVRELQELFPHQRFYIYMRDPDSPKGTLSPL